MTASAYPAAIGLISATLGIGAGVGLVIAGVIVDQLSWQWIFWLGLALTITAIAAVRAFVREPQRPVDGRLGRG